MEKKEKNLGLRIMQRRKAKGIKQSELAEIIGVSENQISNIENGKSFPKMQKFIRICEELDCTPDYLLMGIIKSTVEDDLIDLITSLSLEEKKILWKLIEGYVHRDDNDQI